MLKAKTAKYVEIAIHLLFWALPFIVFSIGPSKIQIGLFKSDDYSLLKVTTYSTGFHIVLVYSVIFLIIFKFRKQARKAFLYSIIIYLFVSIAESVIDKIVYQEILYQEDKTVHFSSFLIINTLFHIFFLIVAYAYSFIRLKIMFEKNEEKLLVEKLRAELNFLRMQTNPHFLFNTLNNIYSLSRKEKATITSEAISKLSRMMRYITYDSNSDFVDLDKEIENIQIYIELQKLRFAKDDDIEISFETEGNLKTKKIAPMLLITLVENAFKYGIDIDKKSFIFIKISLNDNNFVFNIKNTVHRNNHTEMTEFSGIGISNIQKRLDLLTQGKYNLTFSEENSIFTANLVLKL